MMHTLSHDETQHMVSFLDGDSLTRLSGVSHEFWNATRSRLLWQNAAKAMFMKDSPFIDSRSYMGDFRELVVDRNKMNRTFMSTVRVDNITTDLSRRKIPLSTVNGFEFTLIVDPTGNPNIIFPEPSLSVYLQCRPVRHTSDWECCCKFKFILISTKKPNRSWMSSLQDDRFCNTITTWGIHQFVPVSKLRNEDAGYISGDSITIRVSGVLQYMDILLVENYAGYEGVGFPKDGRVYNVPESMTVSQFRNMIGSNKKLWVMTWVSDVLSPTICLDDVDQQASVFSVMGDHENGLYMARVWVDDSETFDNGTPGFIVHVKYAYADTLTLMKSVRVQNFDMLRFMFGSSTDLHIECAPPQYIKDPTDRLQNGQIIVVSKKGLNVREIYTKYMTRLISDAHTMFYKLTLKLADVVGIYEKMGGLGIRAVDVYFYKTRQDPIATLQYILEGRHIGYCCDGCGTTDFIGIRYNCKQCLNYDLCSNCMRSDKDVWTHRYTIVSSTISKNNPFQRIRDTCHPHSRLHDMEAFPSMFESFMS